MSNITAQSPLSLKKIGVYGYRALLLRCPVCGISPIFLPLRQVEGITDWVETLPGCPRCDFEYHREPGYFLLALWVINFSVVAIVGVSEVLLLYFWFQLSVPALMFVTLVTVWAIGLLLVRHTKSLFVAFDHLIHPHTADSSDYPPSGSLGVESYHLGSKN